MRLLYYGSIYLKDYKNVQVYFFLCKFWYSFLRIGQYFKTFQIYLCEIIYFIIIMSKRFTVDFLVSIYTYESVYTNTISNCYVVALRSQGRATAHLYLKLTSLNKRKLKLVSGTYKLFIRSTNIYWVMKVNRSEIIPFTFHSSPNLSIFLQILGAFRPLQVNPTF